MIGELRIGNWLQRLDGSCFQVEAKDFELIENANDFLKPKRIEISPEILEKAGWIKDTASWYHVFYFTDCQEAAEKMQISINVKTGRFSVNDEDANLPAYSKNPKKHVHELQNAVYFLTGQELTINLK